MNKLVSLESQKRISFVPFLGFLIPFIWIYNYSRFPKKTGVFAKSLLLMWVILIPQFIISELLIVIFPNYTIIISDISNCIMSYTLAYGLIKYQSKTIFSKN